MINYLSSFTNTDGASFPDTKGINASGAGATDGTEFVKIFIDDLWGARQAIMDHAGLTPDTVTEAPDTSQFLEALLLIAGGAGEVVQYMKNDDPSVLGDRILLLNGQGVLRASFPELDAAVYVGDSDNPTAAAFFRADNADGSSRNIAGIYLILPETRGYAPRGLDIAASVDPDGTSRDLGSVQVDAMQGHFTNLTNSASAAYGTPPRLNVTTSLTGGAIASMIYSGVGNLGLEEITAGDPFTDGVNGTPRTDLETRMSNFATTFGIRY